MSLLRNHVEGLSKLGITVKVQTSKSCAAVKGLVFNNEVYSVCSTVPVEIEVVKKKSQGRESDFEDASLEDKAPADVESVSESESANSSKGMNILNENLYIQKSDNIYTF